VARPRSEEARRKALAAAGDLIIERGVGAFSIEEVAARSGVAKTTIYRHWPERASLIIDTVRSTFEHVGTPDTGSLRGDLEAFFSGMVRADLSGRIGQLMPCIIDAASRDPEIGSLFEREYPIRTIVERAQARGELPDDLDARVVMGTIVGPIVFRKIMQRMPIDESYIRGCLDVVVTGLAAQAAASGRAGEQAS
jgi:AcrR family transcriptional regulator